MSDFFKSSIGRKVAMALSAIFLMIFLLQHFIINALSVFSAETFNNVSLFMGGNPMVQYVFQPILMFGVIFHFIMGFILEIRNNKARQVSYVKNHGSANSTWASRNMIYTGLVVLAFLVLHLIDFWIPEINHKYIAFLPEDPTRYFPELQHKFENPIRVGAYVISFVFLMLHLLHGFASSFQSMGVTTIRKKRLQRFGKAYAILIPLGFIFIALYHYFNH